MCNQVTVFLKKICVSERKCVTLHPISAKGRIFQDSKIIINILKYYNYVRN